MKQFLRFVHSCPICVFTSVVVSCAYFGDGSRGQPPTEGPAVAVLVDKKPHVSEAENLKFYQAQEKDVLRNGMLMARAIKADPAIVAVVPKEGKANPIAWLQLNVHVDIDVKKHQLRISVPKGEKKWQKAAAAAIAKEIVKWQFPTDTEAANIVKHIDTYQRLLGYTQKEKEELVRTSGPKKELDKCQQDIERFQKKINALVDELSPQQRFFVLETTTSK